MKPLRAGRSMFAMLTLALAMGVGLTLLPDSPYQRFQLLA
jgi:hypothetical protein